MNGRAAALGNGRLEAKLKPELLIFTFRSDSFELTSLVSRNEASGAVVRTIVLPPEHDVALLKAIEAVDRQLPDAVFVVGRTGGASQAGDESGLRVVVDSTAINHVFGTPAEPIDAGGPDSIAYTAPATQIGDRLAAVGMVVSPPGEPVRSLQNSLGYCLLRYVDLRGGETWFGREAPAGISYRVGSIRIGGSAALAADAHRVIRLLAAETAIILPGA